MEANLAIISKRPQFINRILNEVSKSGIIKLKIFDSSKDLLKINNQNYSFTMIDSELELDKNNTENYITKLKKVMSVMLISDKNDNIKTTVYDLNEHFRQLEYYA